MPNVQTSAGVRCACGVACACRGALHSVGVALTLIFWGESLGCGNSFDNLRRYAAFSFLGYAKGSRARVMLTIPFHIFSPKLLF